MNFRRGLFRLWIIGSVLFVLAVAFVSYADIKEEFVDAASLVVERNQIAADPDPAPWELRRLERNPSPWTSLGKAATIAFGIPLFVLALGSSLLWALSGFAATRN